MEATAAPTEPTPVDTAHSEPANQLTATLESMTEAQRNLVSAALEAQNKKIQTLNAHSKSLKEENETMKKDRAVDAAMLDSQLQQFITNMGENATKFGLEQATCAQQLQSANPENVRRTVDRLLMCCNTTMALAAGAPMQGQAAPKHVEMATAEPVIETSQAPSLKRKAATFEPTDDDAASVLRKALQNFAA